MAHFTCKSTAKSGIDTTWTTQPQMLSCGWLDTAPALEVAVPTQFNGPHRKFDADGKAQGPLTPEDFYAMALANCFIGTFKIFAHKSRLDFEQITVRVSYQIEQFAIKEVHFDVGLEVDAAMKNRAERLLQKVSESCLIVNTLNVKKNFTLEVFEKVENGTRS